MKELFEPASVAIIGASRDRAKWGGRILHNLVRYGFSGEIWPVNPGVDQILGVHVSKSIESIPPDVDLAVVAVPAGLVLETVESLGDRGVHAVLVVASGFAELGEEGRTLQDQIVKAATFRGMRLIGPNSLGVINTRTGLVAAATTAAEAGRLPQGGLSIVSHSGAIGLGTVLTRALDRGRGLSKLISLGNESDLTSAEILDFLSRDVDTEAIGIFIEGFRNARDLIDSIRRTSLRGKPVAMLKAGRTDLGSVAAATHTGLLSGSGKVFLGAVEGAGGTWCLDMEDLLDRTLLSPDHIAAGSPPRIAIMSSSGGINTLATDLLAENGIPLAKLSPSTHSELQRILPDFNPITNPLDISGYVAGHAEIQLECLEALRKDDGVDGVMVILTFLPAYVGLAEKLRRDAPSGKLLAFVNTGGNVNIEACLMLQRDLNYPVFSSLSSCAAAIKDAVARARWRSRHEDQSTVHIQTTSHPQGLDDAALFEWLASEGIPCVPYTVIDPGDDPAKKAGMLTYPVVLKALSSDVIHKSDIGAVEFDLKSETEVRAAADRVRERVARVQPKGSRVLVQKQITGALELIVGGKTDRQLGPIVVVGQGGIFVNVLNESVIRPAPISPGDADDMLDELALAQVLEGFRGMSKRDVGSLKQMIVRCSELIAGLAEDGLSFELDLNPVLVQGAGAGSLVADAVLRINHYETPTPYDVAPEATPTAALQYSLGEESDG